ncbi:MAG: hypothetical protein OQJ89_07725, partial [Kangiellaceae bacterium]|nr:hypothetical protein [Kangiellaceae bacterium]
VKSVTRGQLNSETEHVKYDVVFGLASKNISAGRFVKQNGLLILDSNPQLRTKSSAAEIIQLNEQLFQFNVSQDNNSQGNNSSTPVWRTATGKNILSYRKRQGIHQLNFSSRFHPDWTNLVENRQFPIILVALIQNYLSNDNWKVEASHFKTEDQNLESKLQGNKQTADKSSLYSWILLLLAFCWLIERVLAESTSFQFRKEVK